MKTIRVSSNYEMFAAEPGSPANGMCLVVRLSDHEVSNWFDMEFADKLLLAGEEDFELMCSGLTF